ncbi:MAG TPA: WYL domain-containing protein [Burkholderiaceae bacterium]|nr:WYL domain-containing protein [Burkholderiaceae bacterium]
MDRTERFYRIERLIRGRGGVSFQTLSEELEVSRATLKRDLQYLRDRMDAPIVYDRGEDVYRFASAGGTRGVSHELPGLWFSQAEIHALLTMHQLIAGLDSDGVLSRHLQPMLDKLNGMLGATGEESRQMMRRVRIVGAAARAVPSREFERVGSALQERRRLLLRYLTRSRNEVSERTVSPQRLVHYRSTWYLDAWCHRSDGLRRFALDAIERAEVLDQRARDIPLKTVEAEFDASYGIFGGRAAGMATLVFDAEPAQWVAQEVWHPAQRGRRLEDGRYELSLPYADATELLMDVLRYAGQVEVQGDAPLAQAFAARIAAAARRLD